MATFRAAIALAATALLLPACQLFSVSDACGPDGAYCVSSTTGGASGGITGGTNGGSRYRRDDDEWRADGSGSPNRGVRQLRRGTPRA